MSVFWWKFIVKILEDIILRLREGNDEYGHRTSGKEIYEWKVKHYLADDFIVLFRSRTTRLTSYQSNGFFVVIVDHIIDIFQWVKHQAKTFQTCFTSFSLHQAKINQDELFQDRSNLHRIDQTLLGLVEPFPDWSKTSRSSRTFPDCSKNFGTKQRQRRE